MDKINGPTNTNKPFGKRLNLRTTVISQTSFLEEKEQKKVAAKSKIESLQLNQNIWRIQYRKVMILMFQTVGMMSLAKVVRAISMAIKFLVAVKAFQAVNLLLSLQTW